MILMIMLGKKNIINISNKRLKNLNKSGFTNVISVYAINIFASELATVNIVD